MASDQPVAHFGSTSIKFLTMLDLNNQISTFSSICNYLVVVVFFLKKCIHVSFAASVFSMTCCIYVALCVLVDGDLSVRNRFQMGLF